MQLINDKELFTVNELAKWAGVTRATIYNWMNKGLPARINMPGITRFDFKEVNRWFDENNVGIKLKGE
ncbi:MAG: helix-turn-helix domain-containing protein [Candidatus Bathyarchaeota archaeon]|nr:helix-turn-helix domain-containing protein [Candidatus Bathyarchaeota archaeon]